MTTLSISPEQENQRQLKEDASKAYDLLEELRRNLGQLFLHTAGEKKLHDRYIDQRELNTKGYAEKVDNILKRYPSKSSLGKLISTIIHTHKIATGIKSERIDNDEVYTIAHSIALHQATEDKKNIEVITKLLNQM